MPENRRNNGLNVGDTGSDKYLGSPVVVGKLVDDFCNDVYEWTKARGNGSMSKDEMVEHLTSRISDIADIFMGRNNEYSGVMGWNNRFGLGLSIKQTLGLFWDKYKDNYDNDPGKAQFGWLAASVVDSAIASLDDPDIAGASILAKKDQVIKVLLRLNKRL